MMEVAEKYYENASEITTKAATKETPTPNQLKGGSRGKADKISSAALSLWVEIKI